MDSQKLAVLMCALLLTYPPVVGGGPISWASCMAIIGVGGTLLGSAVLPMLGFTSGGIAAGSWAASMMASYAGAVPAGSLFAILQSTGATGGIAWSSFGGISGFCAALTGPFP